MSVCEENICHGFEYLPIIIKPSNLNRTLVGNKTVDHSDDVVVVGNEKPI